MAKTSNRQETFNHKAHDQKKLRAAETRQTEESSSASHKHKKTSTSAQQKNKRGEQWKNENTQQEAERNTLKQTPNCIRLGPAIFFRSLSVRRKPERPPKGSANVKKEQQANGSTNALGKGKQTGIKARAASLYGVGRKWDSIVRGAGYETKEGPKVGILSTRRFYF